MPSRSVLNSVPRGTIGVISLMLLGCAGSTSTTSQQSNAPVTVIAVGDSITLRTDLCLSTDTLVSCNSADRDLTERSYASYIPSITMNLGRSGDTCAVLNINFPVGIYVNQKVGLLDFIQHAIDQHPTQISVLIGTNDVDFFGQTPTDTINCITATWVKIQQAGIEPIAMTYGNMLGRTNTTTLNNLIRQEAANRRIRLVDQASIASYTTLDGIHPDPASAKLAGQLWINVIGK